MKPTGAKNYGSIGHLPESRLGPADHCITQGQALICTTEARDKHDRIIIQEKLDGSNVGVARIDSDIFAITRAGYLASTSPYGQHHAFDEWVKVNIARFYGLLEDGERAVGEWMHQAHGTRYSMPHEPFVLFDIMKGKQRATIMELEMRASMFVRPYRIENYGKPMTVHDALSRLGRYGRHGALDPAEGLIYRVERNELLDKRMGGEREWKVDFLAKYVKSDKKDGLYLESVTGEPAVVNQFTGLHPNG